MRWGVWCSQYSIYVREAIYRDNRNSAIANAWQLSLALWPTNLWINNPSNETNTSMTIPRSLNVWPQNMPSRWNAIYCVLPVQYLRERRRKHFTCSRNKQWQYKHDHTYMVSFSMMGPGTGKLLTRTTAKGLRKLVHYIENLASTNLRKKNLNVRYIDL